MADHLKAAVVMTVEHRLGFRFIDCIATACMPGDPKEGYGTNAGSFSHVAGMIGGSVQCVIYPEQFGLPFSEKGESIHFHASPKEILESCLRAVAEDRCPPEYVI